MLKDTGAARVSFFVNPHLQPGRPRPSKEKVSSQARYAVSSHDALGIALCFTNHDARTDERGFLSCVSAARVPSPVRGGWFRRTWIGHSASLSRISALHFLAPPAPPRRPSQFQCQGQRGSGCPRARLASVLVGRPLAIQPQLVLHTPGARGPGTKGESQASQFSTMRR